MGALRYRFDEDGPFITERTSLSCPPIIKVRDLEYSSLQFEKQDSTEDEESRWLRQLLAPGASLGGARPKSNVRDTDGALWIAKFPSRRDFADIGAWEMVTHHLAVDANIRVSAARAECFNTPHHTFLTQRFDRTSSGERLHFASTMTLLGYTDGISHTEGVRYLELAEFIMRSGVEPEKDLKELWRRIVFSVCVSNTDDHLRNHGFVLSDKGWLLSPAYDINPNPEGYGLSLNIDESDNSLDLGLTRKVAPYFRIGDMEAGLMIEEVMDCISAWERYADRYHISKSEQEFYRSAFITH